MKFLILIYVWASLHSQVLAMLKEWQCSPPDRDGLVHFPDLPVNRTQISDAEVVTHTKAFFIFTTTPDCSGTIIGADFCYALMSETDTQQRQVFQLVKLYRLGDDFIPDQNYTDTIFTALPIDNTKCTQQPNGRKLCCQRNTMSTGLRLEDQGELSFGIIAQNVEMVDYPLLTFGVSRKDRLVRSYRVDYGRLSYPDDVFSNVYNSSNTIETVSSSPVFRMLIQPDTNSTSLREATPTVTVDLLTVIWCLVAVIGLESVALVAFIAQMITAMVSYKRLRKAHLLKCRQYKKTPSQEGAFPAKTQNISYSLPEPTPPIPMRVMYNNAINSQLNTSYDLEPPSTQDSSTADEQDYDDIVDTT